MWPKPTMLDPSSQELIFARDPEAFEFVIQPGANVIFHVRCRVVNREWMGTCLLVQSGKALQTFKGIAERLLQILLNFLVPVQTQNPIPRRLVDSRIFLRG